MGGASRPGLAWERGRTSTLGAQVDESDPGRDQLWTGPWTLNAVQTGDCAVGPKGARVLLRTGGRDKSPSNSVEPRNGCPVPHSIVMGGTIEHASNVVGYLALAVCGLRVATTWFLRPC